MDREIGVQGVVLIRPYPIIERAVEEGVAYAIHRLFKYQSDPLGEDALLAKQDEITTHVMDSLCEVLDFGDE